MSVFPKRAVRVEQRKAPRHEIHFAAYIAPGEQSAHRPCIIHDVSESGARLTVGLRAEIPDDFTLVFSRKCRVVRRAEDDGQIAVVFLPAKV